MTVLLLVAAMGGFLALLIKPLRGRIGRPCRWSDRLHDQHVAAYRTIVNREWLFTIVVLLAIYGALCLVLFAAHLISQ